MSARPVVRILAASLIAVAVAAQWSCQSCKDKQGDDGEDEQLVARSLEGLEAMPAGVRVVIGANVRNLRGSWLVDRAIAQMFRRDPELKERFAQLAQACNFDPAANLDSALLGLADDDAVLVLTGQFTEADLASCVSQSMASSGGSFTVRLEGGRTFYKAGGRDSSHSHVWFTLVGPRTLVLATSPEWLGKATGNGSKVTSSSTMAALLARVDQQVGLWAVGEVDERVGAGLVELTEGKIATPPRSLYAEVDPQTGLRLHLAAVMVTQEDANHLLSLVKKQFLVGRWILAGYGLGPVVRKLGVDSEGKTVYLRLSLSQDELREVLSGIDSTAGPASGPAEPEE